MRSSGILCALTATFIATSSAVAEAPAPPRGNFGGGAIVVRSADNVFGVGNAVIGLRALDERRLEIEATVRGRCTGGDITAAVRIAADGSFSADGTETQEPRPDEKVTTRYKLSGAFTSPTVAEGTITATLERSRDGRQETCKTGKVAFGARKASGELGKRGAKGRTRYYGTTAQRGVGPRRPIVLRISNNGRLISRALFGYQVKCSDGKRAIGVEAPQTDIAISATGRVRDRDKYTTSSGVTKTFVDDRFEAVIGHKGAKGTLSLSDRTLDMTTGNVIQSCSSGEIKWTAAP